MNAGGMRKIYDRINFVTTEVDLVSTIIPLPHVIRSRYRVATCKILLREILLRVYRPFAYYDERCVCVYAFCTDTKTSFSDELRTHFASRSVSSRVAGVIEMLMRTTEHMSTHVEELAINRAQ